MFYKINWADRKPGSVSGDHPSRTAVACSLMRHTLGRVRAAPHNAHFVLLRMGFTRQLCLHSPGELLPHHFNLTTALPVSAECFCCTFPTVTCGGRYPSSLPCGARTFLMRKHAIAWSAQNTAILYSRSKRFQRVDSFFLEIFQIFMIISDLFQNLTVSVFRGVQI